MIERTIIAGDLLHTQDYMQTRMRVFVMRVFVTIATMVFRPVKANVQDILYYAFGFEFFIEISIMDRFQNSSYQVQ